MTPLAPTPEKTPDLVLVHRNLKEENEIMEQTILSIKDRLNAIKLFDNPVKDIEEKEPTINCFLDAIKYEVQRKTKLNSWLYDFLNHLIDII